MIEDKLADQFRAAVTDEPPLGFDPDEVVDRATHDRKRRLATMGASLAVVAVAIGAAATFQIVRSDNSQGGVGAVTTTSQPTSPPAPAPSDPANPCEGNLPTGSTCAKLSPCVSKEEDNCESGIEEPGMEGFPGHEDAIKSLQRVVPQVLTDKLLIAPGEVQTWRAHSTKRCVDTVYSAVGDENDQAIGITVCHDRVTGVDERDNNPSVGQTSLSDGSLLRTYKDRWGLVVIHVRTDGVLVRVSQNIKSGPSKFTAEQMTETATDGRLTF